jgi:hypothetical protein
LLLFEVITEAPVAKHFEKCRVAVVADFIDVLRAQAGLAVRDAFAIRVRLAKQVGDYRLHATAGKQCRRVIMQHKRGATDYFVSALLKEFQIFVSDCFGIHLCYFTRIF